MRVKLTLSVKNVKFLRMQVACLLQVLVLVQC